jgi:hypothetical protein
MRQTPAAALSRAFLQYAAAGAVYGLTFPGVVRLGRKLSVAHNNPRLCELIFSHPFSDQGYGIPTSDYEQFALTGCIGRCSLRTAAPGQERPIDQVR